MEYTLKISDIEVVKKYILFLGFLSEGWSPKYARGKAKIYQPDHVYLRETFKEYASLWAAGNNRRGQKTSWHSYQK